MPETFRRLHQDYATSIPSASHLLLLLVGARIGTRAGWLWVCALIGAISLVLWILNYRRARAVADTPTAKVASAPQGYVELFGTAKGFPGPDVVSPASHRRCVWYRYKMEEKRGKDWVTVSDELSADSFILDDGTGQVVVDPEWAEVLTDHYRRWQEDDRRFSEWMLLPGDTAYAIGEFATVGGANSTLDFAADVNALLTEWKSDKAALKARFDLDGNGDIDVREWELARQAARREIAKQHQEIRSRPGIHMLRKPKDGRAFVISNLAPEQLARRYRRWTAIQLVIAGVAGCGLLMLLFGSLR